VVKADLSNIKLEPYVRTSRLRARARRARVEARRLQAWEVARRAAALLRERFKATQVKVFGSLVRPALFHERSDVDLAVWGLDERDYFRAAGAVLDLDPVIAVDLIEAEFARPPLLAVIERDGMSL
jgi:predicted nucleotidyltransferase